jgi:hypothetical protein
MGQAYAKMPRPQNGKGPFAQKSSPPKRAAFGRGTRDAKVSNPPLLVALIWLSGLLLATTLLTRLLTALLLLLAGLLLAAALLTGLLATLLLLTGLLLFVRHREVLQCFAEGPHPSQ